MKFFILTIVIGLFLAPASWAAGCRPDLVSIRGAWGEASFVVELADTPETRATGLMNRTEMPRRAGMLFVFEAPQRAAFWMKNTLIPLDMIFMDQTGTVTHVHPNAIPEDLTTIHGGDGVLFVLEINGGLSQRFGIGPGDQMQHSAVPQSDAAWSCAS